MRSTRGLLETLGASGSLIAAAACAVLAVSAAVAFHGWPGLDSTGAFPQLRISSVAAPATPPTGRRVAPAVASLVVPVARGGAGGSGRGGGRRTGAGRGRGRSLSGGAPVAAAVQASGGGSLARPGGDSSSARSGGGSSRPTLGDTIRNGTDGAGRAVGNVTSSVGADGGRVNPGVGSAVKGAGGTARKVVSGAGRTVGGVVDHLTGH